MEEERKSAGQNARRNESCGHRSPFHVASQEAGDGLQQGPFGLTGNPAPFGVRQQQTAQHIALGDDGGGQRDEEAGFALRDQEGGCAGLVLVELTRFQDVLQGRGDRFLHPFPPNQTSQGDDAVPVGDDGRLMNGLVDGLADLTGKFAQATHHGVFFEDDFPVLVRVDLQRVALPNPHGPADLFGDDHPAEVVPLCQVGAKKFFKFFKKPTKTDG